MTLFDLPTPTTLDSPRSLAYSSTNSVDAEYPGVASSVLGTSLKTLPIQSDHDHPVPPSFFHPNISRHSNTVEKLSKSSHASQLHSVGTKASSSHLECEQIIASVEEHL
jgi:hypothetical protein